MKRWVATMGAHRHWMFGVLAPASVLLIPMVGGAEASAPHLLAGTYSVDCGFGETLCNASQAPAAATIQVDGQTYTGLIQEDWNVEPGAGVNVDLLLTDVADGNLQIGCFEGVDTADSSVSGNTITFASPMTCVRLDGSSDPGTPAELSTTIHLIPTAGLPARLNTGGLSRATYTLTYP